MTNKYPGTNWFSSITLATILGCGATVVWGVVVLWTVVVVEQFFSRQQPFEQLTFTIDGRALLRTYRTSNFQGDTYRTLDGQKVDVAEVELLNDSNIFPQPIDDRAGPSTRNLPWIFRVAGFAQARGTPSYWYLLHDGLPHGHAYLAGFDPPSKLPIGYIGLRGFRSEAPTPDEQFAIESRQLTGGFAAGEHSTWGREPHSFSVEANAVVFLVVDGSLVRVDLQRQSVRSVPLPDKALSVVNVNEPIAVEDDRRAIYTQRVAVRLPDRVLWLSLEGETLRSIPLPRETYKLSLSVYGTTGPESLVVSDPTARGTPTDIYWINAEGEVARHEKRSQDRPPSDRQAAMWVFTGVVSSPTILTLGSFTLLPWEILQRDEAPDLGTALVESLAISWLPLLVVWSLSTILAVLCYRHHRKYARTGGLVWATFVLLLGVPGLMGYWLHRRWPATEHCRQCGATVPRDRENCLACATELPTPELKGIEIFA